jgi:hypothetical protein
MFTTEQLDIIKQMILVERKTLYFAAKSLIPTFSEQRDLKAARQEVFAAFPDDAAAIKQTLLEIMLQYLESQKNGLSPESQEFADIEARIAKAQRNLGTA